MTAERPTDRPAHQIIQNVLEGGTSAALVAAVAGVPGGVAGVALGAVAPVAYAKLADYIASRRARVIIPTIDVLGDAGLADRLEECPEFNALILNVMERAAKVEWDLHVDAMAAVLRDGIVGDLGDAETDAVMEAIAGMTPDGVAVLVYITSRETHMDSYFVDIRVADDLGWGRSRVRRVFRLFEDAQVVETVGGLIDGGEGWRVNPLAVTVLDYLRDAGATLPV